MPKVIVPSALLVLFFVFLASRGHNYTTSPHGPVLGGATHEMTPELKPELEPASRPEFKPEPEPMQVFCAAYRRSINTCDVSSGFASVDLHTFNQAMVNRLLQAFATSGKINCRIYLNGTPMGRVTHSFLGGYEFIPAS